MVTTAEDLRRLRARPERFQAVKDRRNKRNRYLDGLPATERALAIAMGKEGVRAHGVCAAIAACSKWGRYKNCDYCGALFYGATCRSRHCSDRCRLNGLSLEYYHRKKDDHAYQLRMMVRCRIANHFRRLGRPRLRIRKFQENLFGYTMTELLAHLESTFEAGMSWATHGEWELDHIRPLASFDFSDPRGGLHAAYALNNLMARWKTTAIAKKYGSNQIGNSNKGAKII